jgi:hypothetical protein
MVVVKYVEGSSAFQVPILVYATRKSKKPRQRINNRVHIPNYSQDHQNINQNH